MNFLITKASGEREPFNAEKLRHSLQKAGAQEGEIAAIIDRIRAEKPQDTQTIHALAVRALKNKKQAIADRYNLKRGIMELGPEGYSFEKYVGALFRAQGYKTQISQIVHGACVDHEIDVIAQKDNKMYMIETKFHSKMGFKSDVKVALYVQARFEDIRDYLKQHDPAHIYHNALLVTNTKFTSQAIQYGTCKNMQLLGWNYPEKNNLAQLVETYNLFPITTLTSLKKSQKQLLMKEGLVMCKDAEKYINALRNIGLSEHRIKKIIAESQAVCNL